MIGFVVVQVVLLGVATALFLSARRNLRVLKRMRKASDHTGALRAALWHQVAETLATELARWGWGDMHYGSQGQEKSVTDALGVYRAALDQDADAMPSIETALAFWRSLDSDLGGDD